MRRLLWLPGLFALVLAGCDETPQQSATEAVQKRLVGTWLREYEEQGTAVRRVLVLQAQGSFSESSLAVQPADQPPIRSESSGEWTFDGTNLKRRYLRIDGKPLSAPTMPYATFALSFPSRYEFIGVDHVRKLEVRYQRVGDGTQP